MPRVIQRWKTQASVSDMLGMAFRAQGKSTETHTCLTPALARARMHGYGLLERRIREELE